MLYNFVADSIRTKKLCSKLSSSEVQRRKTAVLRFRVPLWGLRDKVHCYVTLIGKLVVDFLFVLIELFL